MRMAKFNEMDDKATLSEQLEEDVSPVILINKFSVKPEEADQFLKAWQMTLHTLRASLDSFPHSSIEELEAAL